jgi:hypothetical protein
MAKATRQMVAAGKAGLQEVEEIRAFCKSRILKLTVQECDATMFHCKKMLEP